jgi:hypothetical protein
LLIAALKAASTRLAASSCIPGIDLQTFEENMSKVTNYCSGEKNFKVPVMKAVEQVLGKSN